MLFYYLSSPLMTFFSSLNESNLWGPLSASVFGPLLGLMPLSNVFVLVEIPLYNLLSLLVSFNPLDGGFLALFLGCCFLKVWSLWGCIWCKFHHFPLHLISRRNLTWSFCKQNMNFISKFFNYFFKITKIGA